MAARFRPRELRKDATPDELRRQLNDYFRDIAADLGAITARPRITEVQLGDYTARFGEIVRMAPPAAGARLILPAPNAAQPNGRVTLLLVGKSGAVTVEAVSSAINGADTLALGAGEGLVEFTLAPDADGWLAASSDVVLAPAASTSIVYDVASHEYQRAALTGAVTAAQNSNATAFGAAAAKSVLVNAGNASAVPAFLAGTGAFQYLRVNSANTGLEWAVLSLASFPAQASDTFLGNVSGSSGVPSAVNLSSLAGTDLTFSAHALSVSSTWSSVLGRGATSGAHNPIVDASQWLGFGSSPGSVSTGQIRADGDWTAHSNGVASLSGDGGASLISSGGDINLLTLFGDIKLTTVLGGRVAIPSGFLDYTGQSASTPSVASGHGLVWTKTDSPSRLYFTDDANTDNKLAYVSDITGIANSQLANMASDTVKGNVSGSTGAPSDVNLSSLAGTGLTFSSHQFSITPGTPFNLPRLDASTSPIYLFDFNNRVTDLSGSSRNLSSGSPQYAPIWANQLGLLASTIFRPSHDAAGLITGDITLEGVCVIPPGVSVSTYRIVSYCDAAGTDETAANNFQYSLGISYTANSGATTLNWLSEHSTGINDSYSVSSGSTLQQLPIPGIPFYVAATRISNVIQFYLNGVAWGAASSALTTPDGGSTAVLVVGLNQTSGNIVGQHSLRITSGGLSAATIKAAYNATVGQIFGQI